MLYVELLGCPAIYRNGKAVKVSRKRVRILLYVLAASGNSVSRAQLEEMLWPDKDGVTASQNLSITVSYLKKALGENVVTVRNNQISVSPSVMSDIKRISDSAARNDAENNLEILKLFKGPFLDGVELRESYIFEQWKLQTATYWLKQFVDISLKTAKQLCEKGQYEQAIDILDKAIAAEPLDEELYCMKMNTLFASGRRSMVSSVYQSLSAMLVEELGLGPSRETTLCYDRILRSDLGEKAAASQESDYRAEDAGFVDSNAEPFFGRQGIKASIDNDRKSHFILISGKSGIGKTSLVNNYISASHLPCIKLDFRQQESRIPYYGIIKYLRSYALNKSNESTVLRIHSVMDSAKWSVLCCLVPELIIDNKTDNKISPISLQQAKEAFELFVFLLSDGRPYYIFIDDIHYADAESLEVLSYMVTQPLLNNIRFFATYRPSLSSEITNKFFNFVQQKNHLRVIALDRLDNESMMQILLYFRPDVDKTSADKLVKISDGNPFYLKSIARSLDSDITEKSGVEVLQRIFDHIYFSLSPDSMLAIQKLAVIGESCDERLFRRLCVSSEGVDNSYEISQELFRSTAISRDTDGTIRFAHASIFDYIATKLEQGDNNIRALHRLAAEAMVQAYGANATGQQLISITENYLASDTPEQCGEYAYMAGAYLFSISNFALGIKYFKIAYQHLPPDKKYDAILCMYSKMLTGGQIFEARIYIDQAYNQTAESGRREYMLFFEALLMLCEYNEFFEIIATMPCYSIDVDSRIETVLAEAEEIAEKKNSFLLLNIWVIQYRMLWICGQRKAASDIMMKIIRKTTPTINNNDTTVNMLFYETLSDIISLLNQSPNSRITEMILFEESVFNDFPMRSFFRHSIGVKALLANLQGNVDECVAMMYKEISSTRKENDRQRLVDALNTQAMLIKKANNKKSYSLNYEAYIISKEMNYKYSLIRALKGLIATCSTYEEAVKYCRELEDIALTVQPGAISHIIKNNVNVIKKRFGHE